MGIVSTSVCIVKVRRAPVGAAAAAQGKLAKRHGVRSGIGSLAEGRSAASRHSLTLDIDFIGLTARKQGNGWAVRIVKIVTRVRK